MDSMSGCDIRLVFTFSPKDSVLQYKKCVRFLNNFPCISNLDTTNQLCRKYLLQNKFSFINDC